MTVLLSFLAVGAIVGGAIWAAQRIAEQRTAALAALAGRIGWGFREDVPFESIPNLDRFELFTRGRRRKLRNLMTSPPGDIRAVVFDYTFTTGGGKSQQTHRQTVFYATSHHLDLPAFSIRPEHIFHRIGELVGFQDIDISERPEFSRLFLLRGEDEGAIRAALPDAMLEILEARPRTCMAAAGHELLYWRAGGHAAADEIETLLDNGFELCALLSRPSAPEQSSSP